MWNAFNIQTKMIWKSFVTIIKSRSRDEKKMKRFKAIIITLCVEWAYYNRDSYLFTIFTKRRYRNFTRENEMEIYFSGKRKRICWVYFTQCSIMYTNYKATLRETNECLSTSSLIFQTKILF